MELAPSAQSDKREAPGRRCGGNLSAGGEPIFTGLVEEIGTVASLEPRAGNLLIKINCQVILLDLREGDSVSVSGACLTVTSRGEGWFVAEAISHTLKETTLGEMRIRSRVNLERALRMGDRLGGHIVQGHVDGVGRVTKVRFAEGATDLFIDPSPEILKLIAPRGSVAIDGVSLTVAEKSGRDVHLTIVPYTLQQTTLGDLTPGQRVNIETDLIVRWLADRFRDGEVTADGRLQEAGWGGIHLEE